MTVYEKLGEIEALLRRKRPNDPRCKEAIGLFRQAVSLAEAANNLNQASKVCQNEADQLLDDILGLPTAGLGI